MPMYDYICDNCKHKEDLFFAGDEEKPKRVKCPECGKIQLRRNWSNKDVPIHFSDDFKEENKINYDRSPSGRKRFF